MAGVVAKAIGIGYDLGYNTERDIENDWIKYIGSYQVGILKMFAGLRGEKAHIAMKTNKMAGSVTIPYQAAYEVFVHTSLPRYAKAALKIYRYKRTDTGCRRGHPEYGL